MTFLKNPPTHHNLEDGLKTFLEILVPVYHTTTVCEIICSKRSPFSSLTKNQQLLQSFRGFFNISEKEPEYYTDYFTISSSQIYQAPLAPPPPHNYISYAGLLLKTKKKKCGPF